MTRRRPRAPRARGLRGRLLVSALAAITVVLAALVAAFNLVLASRLDSEANHLAQDRASAVVSSLTIVGGRIALPEAPDDRNPDTQVWVFDGHRALERPQSPVNDRAAEALAARAPALVQLPSTDTRLAALPVTHAGRRVGAVVAGVSLAPYEQTRRTALIASAILALVVFGCVALADRWLIDRALRPVSTMTRQAAAWSEHDLERRFALGPARDEITELASTLDRLLERLAASLRHEQRLSAEISHELRTPLTNIVAEAQHALLHGSPDAETRTTLEHILQAARTLGRTLDTLMAAARTAQDPRRARCDAAECARAAARTALASLRSRELQIAVDAPARAPAIAAEPDLVERILAPLLDNAIRHAREQVRIVVEPNGAKVQLAVEDDGPGIPSWEREAIFEPGHRGRTSAGAPPATPGAGLGLALCRRLARTAGGEVRVESPRSGGARFVVALPAHPPHDQPSPRHAQR